VTSSERQIRFAGADVPTHSDDGRLNAPAFHRNCEPIWSVLAPHLAERHGDVLELGSGTGQHILEFARRAPHLTWWPSDFDPTHLMSIEAWRCDAGLSNLRPATRIDLSDPNWQFDQLKPAGPASPPSFAAMLCANVIHIAPWRVAEGLFAGAGRQLAAGAPLFLYGPFKRDGEHTSPSNAAFDRTLKAQNADWGVRDMKDVAMLAERNGLKLAETIAMPANNFILIFIRRT